MSYMGIRKSIGFLGAFLPVILWGGVWLLKGTGNVEPSISDYYHTIVGDVFVGVLCGVALFLFAYNGPDREDRIAGYLGCAFALGVAFFPTPSLQDPDAYPYWIGRVHFISAALFFGVLIYFSLVLFTRHGRVMTERKKMRNTVYHICAYIMIGCVVGIALYFFWLEQKWPGLERYDPIFYLESFALIAFGISWLVKGELILQDLKPAPSSGTTA